MAASLAFDSTKTDGSGTGAGGTITFAMTGAAASGAERVVVVAAVGTFTNADFTACTIDGQTGTRIGTLAKSGTSGDIAYITAYRANGTASTSFNVVVTAGAVCYDGLCALYKLTGAGTVYASTTSTTDSPSLNVNTITNGTLLTGYYCWGGAGGKATTWTGVTERYDSVLVFSDELFTGGSFDTVSTESPRTVSASSSPVSSQAAAIAVSFNPSAAAATSRPVFHRPVRWR